MAPNDTTTTSGPLATAHVVTKLPAQDLEAALSALRDRGLEFERFDVPGFEARGDVVVVPSNYPSKGTGELGAFFRDSEGNLLAIGQATR